MDEIGENRAEEISENQQTNGDSHQGLFMLGIDPPRKPRAQRTQGPKTLASPSCFFRPAHVATPIR